MQFSVCIVEISVINGGSPCWRFHCIRITIIIINLGQSCNQSGQLRLFESATFSGTNLSNAGRVEICMGGVWGTIAADSIAAPWSEKNAQVACIQLGFTGVINAVFQRTYALDKCYNSHRCSYHYILVLCLSIH